MKKWPSSLIVFLFLSITSCLSAANQQNWTSWLNEVKQQAFIEGISEQVINSAFLGIHEPSRQIKNLAHSQPEHRLTYSNYLSSRADNARIAIGRRQFIKNKALLEEIGQHFGVDPCFIVSFWGMESSYGSYMGNFPVIKSLATLAYESNRPNFFRKELFTALHILNDGHVSLANFKGEWAGASGQPQFLPSSWVQYAVDYDHDGHKDIWASKPDVFASIANYMNKNGWQAGQPWAIYVKLPTHFDTNLQGKAIVKSVAKWNDLGVRTESNQSLPYQNLQASIVQPNGGPTFLAYPNYKMILRYNNSIYYAGAIGYMADKICNRY
jgi:membrane-bound lytic murein transglycosylase B